MTDSAAQRDDDAFEPLFAPHKKAMHILQCGHTKYWGVWVKSGLVEVVKPGGTGRSMATMRSIKRIKASLNEPTTTD